MPPLFAISSRKRKKWPALPDLPPLVGQVQEPVRVGDQPEMRQLWHLQIEQHRVVTMNREVAGLEFLPAKP